MSARRADRRPPAEHGRGEDTDLLARLGGIIVWIGVPLIAWAAIVWAAIQAARSVL